MKDFRQGCGMISFWFVNGYFGGSGIIDWMKVRFRQRDMEEIVSVKDLGKSGWMIKVMFRRQIQQCWGSDQGMESRFGC